MYFRPGRYKTVLSLWKAAGYQLNGVINAIDTNTILVIHMEVRPVMRRSKLDVHANDDTKETSDFRQRLSPGTM